MLGELQTDRILNPSMYHGKQISELLRDYGDADCAEVWEPQV